METLYAHWLLDGRATLWCTSKAIWYSHMFTMVLIRAYTIYLHSGTYTMYLQDGIVSHDEWLNMWGECAESVMTRQEFPYWLAAYMGFMFEAADTSGTWVFYRPVNLGGVLCYMITRNQKLIAYKNKMVQSWFSWCKFFMRYTPQRPDTLDVNFYFERNFPIPDFCGTLTWPVLSVINKHLHSAWHVIEFYLSSD